MCVFVCACVCLCVFECTYAHVECTEHNCQELALAFHLVETESLFLLHCVQVS